MASVIPTLPSPYSDRQGQTSHTIDVITHVHNCFYGTDLRWINVRWHLLPLCLLAGRTWRKPRWSEKPTIPSLKRFSILRYVWWVQCSFFCLFSVAKMCFRQSKSDRWVRLMQPCCAIVLTLSVRQVGAMSFCCCFQIVDLNSNRWHKTEWGTG